MKTLNIETHPFNDKIGLPSLNETTNKLIIGTFPAFQVTNENSPRLNFYYGSTDNKFWDLIHEVLDIKSEITTENILDYLKKNNFGIIDIIRKCYRKNNTSSADEDLSIIEFQDMVNILTKFKVDTIYTTSKLVTRILKQQIEPFLDKKKETVNGNRKKKKKEIFIPIKIGEFEFEKVQLPAHIFKTSGELKIITLYSPSDQGIRGIAKGLNIKKIDIKPEVYRRKQYEQFFKK